MDSLMMQLMYGLLAALYVLLLKHKRNEVWGFFAVVFVGVAITIRRYIRVDAVHDFAPYYASFRQVKSGVFPADLLIEPYRVVLFKFFLLFDGLSDMSAMRLIYYFHFAAVTAFFVWLARNEKVSSEAALILFLAFYPTMAFVWIRSGMSIVAAGALALVAASRHAPIAQWLLPLIHASSAPFVVAYKTRSIAVIKRAVILALAGAAGFYLIESSYMQYVFSKWDRYSSTSDARESRNLLLFHGANVLAFLYFYIVSPQIRRSYVVLLLMGTYIVLFFFSPIMGLRTFPFVLIAIMAEKITFPPHAILNLVVCLGYLPIFFSRFEQILAR